MAATIFISFDAPGDEPAKDQLARHLAVARRRHLIEPWSCSDIRPGTDWQQEVNTYLEQADLVVLLLTARFFASDIALRR